MTTADDYRVHEGERLRRWRMVLGADNSCLLYTSPSPRDS